MKKIESKIKPQMTLELFRPEYVGMFDTCELLFLKNVITWASKPVQSMQSKNFKYDNVGFWVSSKKAVDWGMTVRKYKSTIKKLNQLKIKDDSSSKILCSARVQNIKRLGSQTFIFFNTTMLYKIICWEGLNEDMETQLSTFINRTLCNNEKDGIIKQTQNFFRMDKLKNGNTKEISVKIRQALNTTKNTEKKNVLEFKEVSGIEMR